MAAKPGPGIAPATISLVIPSYRRPADLRRCLGALKLQTRPANEVLVVLRADDSETMKVVSEYRGELKGLGSASVAEPGLLAAINRGLDCAAGDFIVLTDDDTEAFPDWLQRIEATFLSDAAIGAVGGRDWIHYPDIPDLAEPPTVNRVGELTWWGRNYGNHHCHLRGHVKKVDFLKGVNFAIRTSALGDYRIDTFLRGSGAQVGTEMDLCMHMKRRGFSIVFDDRILVNHYASPRPDTDGKVDAMTEARTQSTIFPDIRFNNQYLTAKHCNLFLSLTSLCNGLLAGSYYTPGLLASLKWTVLKGDTAIWRRFLQQAKSTVAGFAAGRRARGAGTATDRGRA